MNWISRSDLGWPASAAPVQVNNPRGIKIHYEGTYVPVVDHGKCAGRWTAIRKAHLANKAEGYSDVAYNLAVCRHGFVLEGRGAGRRTGANGNQSLNAEHYAILVMIGSEGDVNPTSEAVAAIKEAIQYLRTHEKPAGREIKGHRDGYATSCPGGPLYDLVGHGQLEPDAKPSPVYAPFPGAGFFKVGRVHPLITAMGKRLVQEGCSAYKVGPSDDWSEADRKSYQNWQNKLGYSGSDADGYPGPTSWNKLKVPQV